MPVYDAHAHLSLGEGQVEKLLAAMDEAEIAKAIVVGGGLISVESLSERLVDPEAEYAHASSRFDNEQLLRDCERSGGRLLPFFFCDPATDVDLYARLGKSFSGLKLGPVVHGFDYEHSALAPLADLAASFRDPIYTHCLPRPGVTVQAFTCWAKRHPRTTFILGHAGVHPLDVSAIETIRDAKNILFETSGGYRFAIETAVKRLGAERVLFGSEYPLQDPVVELTKIRRLRVSSDAIDLIAGGNLQRYVEGLAC